jgi:hypothetical protein
MNSKSKEKKEFKKIKGGSIGFSVLTFSKGGVLVFEVVQRWCLKVGF